MPWRRTRTLLLALAFAGLALAPAALAAEPLAFAAAGNLHRFKDFRDVECIGSGDDSKSTMSARGWLVGDTMRLHVEGWTSCAWESYRYYRGYGGEYDLVGDAESGYRYDNAAWCAFVHVGPLPATPHEPWSVSYGEPNLVLGGCEVFEAQVYLADGSPPSGILPGPLSPS